MVKNLPNFLNPIQFNPPSYDETELSLFGPGIGECIVAHMGHNEWVIVDSCLEASTQKPVPLNYLGKLGIGPSKNVKLFIITHWHSDHIRGASQIAYECEAATICFSESFLKEEFLSLIAMYSGLDQVKILDKETCGTREISSVIKTIKTRCEQNKTIKSAYYIFASADKRLYQNLNSEIWALSPSSQSILNSLTEICSLIPQPSVNEIRGVIPKPDQNHNAIATWIKHGENTNILLGSDLEETKDPLTGWSVVVNSPNRPFGKANIFKIPHHGSKNAHSDSVWKEMVESKAIGILSSKLGGRSSIPKASDIERLKNYAHKLFITQQPIPKKQKHDRTVERTIKGVAKRRIPLNGDIGQIQIRIDKNSEIKVGLKKPAAQI